MNEEYTRETRPNACREHHTRAHLQAELMEMVAKDEAKEPKKAKKKAKKKAGKADWREEVAVCGCGAVCDQCDRCNRRSKSPIRGAPSLPVQAPKSPKAPPGKSEPEGEDSEQTQHTDTVSPLWSPSRSTLGADLVSTPRQSPAAQVHHLTRPPSMINNRLCIRLRMDFLLVRLDQGGFLPYDGRASMQTPA